MSGSILYGQRSAGGVPQWLPHYWVRVCVALLSTGAVIVWLRSVGEALCFVLGVILCGAACYGERAFVARADKRDAEGETKFHALLEASPDGIVIVNDVCEIVLVNMQAEEIFGYERSELLGRPVEVLMPAGFRERVPSFIDGGDAADPGDAVEFFGRRKDGTEFPVEVSLSPLKTKEKMLVTGAIRDVSARERARQALKEKNEELERANQAKDRFLATMSHELRTPLNAVLGFTGTLLMGLPGPLTAEQRRQLETIRSSAQHQLSLINDLLDLATIQSGKVTVLPTVVCCGDVLREVLDMMRPVAEGKGLVLEATVPPEEILLKTDRRALGQILLNLISNAISFTQTGSVKVELVQTLAEGLRQGKGCFGIEVTVTDTGIGIAPEDEARIFAPFERLDNGRQVKKGGSGLGLHLSSKLAGLLGGSIRFQTKLGEGSRFILTLKGS